MSQNIFLDPTVSSLPTLTGGSTGNGTLTVDKLSHFTITQDCTAICTATDPFTVFNIIGSLDGPVGVAVVGTQFIDQDKKLFLTIQQGPVLFEVGDTFEFSVEQGTDLTQSNIDTYDELPQKNFGTGVIGENKGDHNIRFNEASAFASKIIQDLEFVSKIAGADGNSISIEYIAGSFLTAASKIIQDLTYTANTPGSGGNDIQIAYEEFDAAIPASRQIQDIEFTSKLEGTLGNVTSIEYIGGGTAGSEVVNVIGDKIQVQIEDGVSTADQIRIAIGLNGTAFALVDGISTGTGLEPQTLQAETFLLGGTDAVGDAGNEVVTVLGNLITVKLESGVSTAQNVFDALFASVPALTLITPSITGVASTAQIAPVAATNLENGADDVGIPGSEIVSVSDDAISVTFVSGSSTSDQIKTALESNIDADALVTVNLVNSANQTSPVSKTQLSGGLGSGTYAFNVNELSDSGNFFEGNAPILINGLNNQGDEVTQGNTTKNGTLKLDDDEVSNESGPSVENTQKTINNLIQNGKALIYIANEERALWSQPAGTLDIDDDLKIFFTETGIINTILSSEFPAVIADNESLWVTVDRNNNVNLSLSQGLNVPDSPNGENIFRIVTRQGTSLIWWDNTLQREGKRVRIGEGSAAGAYQEKLGTGNGAQTIFPILSGLFPVNQESILVFANAHQFVSDDWTWDQFTNQIEFVDPPELGVEIYIYYLTEGETVAPPTISGVEQSYVHTVSVTEIMNKQLQLIATPAQPSKVLVDIVGGGTQVISIDFGITGDIFDWDGLGLDGVIEAGDLIRFHFFT